VKREFIRSLWGNVSQHREGKIQKEILSTKDKNWFVVLTFGIDNHNWLEENGFRSILINEAPVIWDLETEMYRHKLEVFREAFNYFDEIVFLDWDCIPIKDIGNSWKNLNKKESFQANLFQYRTKKCLWRVNDQRKVCNGGFAYFRESSIPSKMIDFWDEFHIWVDNQQKIRNEKGKDLRFREKCLIFDDEPAMSKYIDWASGGEFCGLEKYWDLFEPEICNVRRKSAFSKEMIGSKESCFIHKL